MDIEEEINNFIMIWATVAISSCYCYGTTKLVPKGTTRLLLFSPILCLFFILPLYLKTVSLCVNTAFFVTWLASFKILLLAFDNGPLSTPSLPLFNFVIISCFPINPTKQNQESDKNIKIDTPFILHYATKGLAFIFLTILGYYKDKLPQQLFVFLLCIYVYLALEICLVVVATGAHILTGLSIDRPFDHPYLSTSLRDFWGRRWNRVAASSLKSTIFYPILNVTSRLLGRKWAAIWALVVTFVVSDVMHEIIFYYLGRVRLGRGIPIFFVFQGICVVVESFLKNKIGDKWRLPRRIVGPLIFLFMVWTFMWLALPELLELKVDDKVLQEYVAMATFTMDLGLSWAEMGWPCRIQFATQYGK